MGGLRLGGRSITAICVGIRERSTEGSKLVPVVAAGEDAAETENDDQKKSSPKRKA